MDWSQAGRKWLQDSSDRAFSAWLGTREGVAWKKQQNRPKAKSPQQMGFVLPDFIHPAIKALNSNDKEAFLAIRHVENFYEVANRRGLPPAQG